MSESDLEFDICNFGDCHFGGYDLSGCDFCGCDFCGCGFGICDLFRYIGCDSGECGQCNNSDIFCCLCTDHTDDENEEENGDDNEEENEDGDSDICSTLRRHCLARLCKFFCSSNSNDDDPVDSSTITINSHNNGEGDRTKSRGAGVGPIGEELTTTEKEEDDSNLTPQQQEERVLTAEKQRNEPTGHASSDSTCADGAPTQTFTTTTLSNTASADKTIYPEAPPHSHKDVVTSQPSSEPNTGALATVSM